MHHGIEEKLVELREDYEDCVDAFLYDIEDNLDNIWEFDDQDVTGDREVFYWYENADGHLE